MRLISHLIHSVLPVAALSLHAGELAGITALRTLFYAATHPWLGLLACAHHLPSFCGAYYFKALGRQDKMTKRACIAAPLVCMALFMSTCVGAQAWFYSLYWLIPAGIAAAPRTQMPFLRALASTLMTHAVGSVIFIWITPMTPLFWAGLLPVVAAERLMIAAGITVMYYALGSARSYRGFVIPRIARA